VTSAVLAGKPLLVRSTLLPTRTNSSRPEPEHIHTQVSAAGNRVDLLDEACEYVKGLPFADAFPGIDDTRRVDAVAVDISSGKVRSVQLPVRQDR
jgi:hypothetical protein